MVERTRWLCKWPVAHIVQAVTALLVLQMCPCKRSKHLGLGAVPQELEAAVMLLMVAEQGPPNLKVTLLAWEVLKLQIAGGWASIAGKHIIACDHHIAAVLIPLGTAGDRKDIRPGGSSVRPKAATVTVLRLLSPMLITRLGSTEAEERTRAAVSIALPHIQPACNHTDWRTREMGEELKGKEKLDPHKEILKQGRGETAEKSSTDQRYRQAGSSCFLRVGCNIHNPATSLSTVIA